MRAAPEEPRHAEPDHHAHDDADMREDFVGEGELLFHGAAVRRRNAISRPDKMTSRESV